tara:strand:+ start:366 stop:548 length:183 start_codon:yes stop_codon:yes gene_type:complete
MRTYDTEHHSICETALGVIDCALRNNDLKQAKKEMEAVQLQLDKNIIEFKPKLAKAMDLI